MLESAGPLRTAFLTPYNHRKNLVWLPIQGDVGLKVDQEVLVK